MKVGMIGLGRTGEGISRRMIEKGIEVWGYSSSSYENACGQYEEHLMLSMLVLKFSNLYHQEMSYDFSRCLTLGNDTLSMCHHLFRAQKR